MSTPPNTTATARQESSGRVIAPSDTEESTFVRRLSPGRTADLQHVTHPYQGARPQPLVEGDIDFEGDFDLADDIDLHDTIPCRPPVAELTVRPNDLDRTLRFARLVRDTLADDHPLARLLELALLRRDAALLQSLLRELHRQQMAEATTQIDEAPRRSERVTLLPPAPKSA